MTFNRENVELSVKVLMHSILIPLHKMCSVIYTPYILQVTSPTSKEMNTATISSFKTTSCKTRRATNSTNIYFEKHFKSRR